MKQILTTGTVLARTDFQEADRIITVLTPDQGKIRAIAKGVRRPKSKLVGGIELFSVSNFTFLPGRGELMTLVSSRLIAHYGNIVRDVERTMLGYDLLKRMNRLTEDTAGKEYFELLKAGLTGLEDQELPKDMLELWFDVQLLKITGHAPNLKTDTAGKELEKGQKYVFSFDDMAFVLTPNGPHGSNLIKLLRLAYATKSPTVLVQVKGAENTIATCLQLTKLMLARFIRI